MKFYEMYEELKTKDYSIDDLMKDGMWEKSDMDISDVDTKELDMGIKVEHEHTKNREIAKKIALDHLAEISDYYTRLAKMEADAKKEQDEESDEEDEESDEESDEDEDN